MRRIIVVFSIIACFLSFQAFAGKKTAVALFSMGCFWCAESEFRDPKTHAPLPGIISLSVGYAGGVSPNPTYTHHEGYKEALQITYDPAQITYETLLDIFWHNIDPFDPKGQFCDKGLAYTAAIFYTDNDQKLLATKTKEQLQSNFGKTIVTEILPFTTFYDAEKYHQNYKAKNPVRYQLYRWNCGRDARLKALYT